jgi:hypothetical protein
MDARSESKPAKKKNTENEVAHTIKKQKAASIGRRRNPRRAMCCAVHSALQWFLCHKVYKRLRRKKNSTLKRVPSSHAPHREIPQGKSTAVPAAVHRREIKYILFV